MPPCTTSKVTTDHEEIRRWAEERGARPSAVIRTGSDDDPGTIRLDFPGYRGAGSLEEISWDEWFKKFDEQGLALLYQEQTAAREKSNFNKIVSRETVEEVKQEVGGRGRSASDKASGKSAKAASGLRSTGPSPSRGTSSSSGERRPEEREQGREATTRRSTSTGGRGFRAGRSGTSLAAEKLVSAASRTSASRHRGRVRAGVPSR